MKKVLLAFILCILASQMVFGQAVKVSIGINGGGLATQMMTEPAPSNPMYISGYGGAFASIHLGKAFTIRGAANYAMQGGTYKENSADIKVTQSYLQVPVTLLLNAGRVISFEFGILQNILLQSNFNETGSGGNYTANPDPGALKYNFGAVGGICINMGKVVFLNLRYCYGLSNSYVIHGKGFPTSTISAGLGFNIYTSKKSAF